MYVFCNARKLGVTTWLDNLKLGYGGTKTEMERLLADAQELSGIEYNIDNLADVYNAIHVIQESLGVTGTTALEAESTFTGSFNSMKAAFSNFMATLSLGENSSMTLTESLSALVQSAATFLIGNALPMLINIVTSFPSAIFMALGNFTSSAVGSYVSQLISYFTTFITSQLPQILQLGITSIGSFVTGLVQSLPEIVQGAGEMISSLILGIANSLPDLIASAIDIVVTLAATIISNLPQILATGVELVAQLLVGILSGMVTLIAKIPSLVKQIINGFATLATSIVSVGKNLVQGLWNGISSAKDWLLSKISSFKDAVLSGIKSFFGIGSPSKLFEDEVGIFLAQGIGVGFEDEMSSVTKTMEDTLPTSFDVSSTLSYNQTRSAIGTSPYSSDDIADKIIVQVYNTTTVDGTPLLEKAANYTVKKITNQQRGSMRMKGQYA